MSNSRLISVQTNVVQETIVGRICERVADRLRGDLPDPPSSLLSDPLARAGYFARIVESELFQPARSPMPGLAEELRARLRGGASWPVAAAALAHDLAAREPAERPDPGDPGAVSWRVPGPGGHVRHYVARRLIDKRVGSGGKRDFIYGFLIRCCEEAVPRDGQRPAG